MKTVHNDITGSGEKYTIFALLKFGQKEHLDELLKKGHLFFSSKQSLRGNKKVFDSDDYRYDSFEGATLYEAHGAGIYPLKNTLTGEEYHLPALRLQFSGKPEVIFGNIASFYGVTEQDFSDNILAPIDSRMKAFGSHFILIFDYQNFMKRISIALDKLKLDHTLGKVEYFAEENFKGELHFFHKRSRFSYQKEYRIHLERQSIKPFILKIGNLKQFAVVCHSDTLEYLRIILDPERGKLDIQYLKPVTKKN